MRAIAPFILLCLISLCVAAPAAEQGAPPAPRRPAAYLAIFMNGYGGDTLPKDDAKFERLLRVITQEGHFNAILCQYSPQREALCRQHKVAMVVDLLAEPHVYKEPEKCEALLRTLRGNATVAAYHLWSDRFGKTGPGRARDIENVRAWDPTHATLSGTHEDDGIAHLAQSDFVSYYDFSWKRGPEKNFRHLLAAWRVAALKDNRLGRYCETDAGLPGKGNPNRLLYIQTTSIACGLRLALWHIGSRIMDMERLEFNQYGRDLATVNAYIEPMREEIARIGLPAAIYSTPISIDANNRPLAARTMPPGLEKHAFPADFWVQPVAGEFVVGISKYEQGGRDVLFLANHNAYAEQEVVLKLAREARPKLFNRQRGQYESLPVKMPQRTINLKLDPAGGAIVLFE